MQGKYDVNVATGLNSLNNAIESAVAGQILQLSAGEYRGTVVINDVRGTADQPVVIRGAGQRQTTLHGNSSTIAVDLKNSEYVILENLKIMNPDSQGRSGREQLVKQSDNKRNEEGIKVSNSKNISIRYNFFDEIGTRGVLVVEGSEDVLVEHNIFADVGNDTAGGDVAAGSSKRTTVRYNLLAGNVDGTVQQGTDVL